MNEFFHNLDIATAFSWSIALLIVGIFVIQSYNQFIQERKKNVIDEINLEGQKISLKVDNTPLSDLVDDANKSYVRSGDDTQKK